MTVRYAHPLVSDTIDAVKVLERPMPGWGDANGNPAIMIPVAGRVGRLPVVEHHRPVAQSG